MEQLDYRIPLDTVYKQAPVLVDPVAAQSKAYSLQEQGMGVEQQEQARNDQSVVQDYIKSGGDLHTEEGVKKAVGALKGKVTPKTYMGLVDYSNKYQEHQMTMAQQLAEQGPAALKNFNETSEFGYKALAPVLDTYNRTWREKLKAEHPDVDPDKMPDNPFVVEAKTAARPAFDAAKAAQMQIFSQMGGASPAVAAVMKNISGMDPDSAESAFKASEWSRKLATDAAKLRDEKAKARLTEGRADVIEQGGPAVAEYNAMVEQYGADSPQARAALQKMSGSKASTAEATLTDEDATGMAKRMAAGEKGVLAGVGRGAQGSANILKVQSALTKLNLPPDAIARAQTELAATSAGLKSLAARGAKIDAAALEVEYFADNALGSLEKVKRGNIVLINDILRKFETGTGSPAEVEFATFVQSLIGAYASVISRGNPTVSSQEEAAKIIRKDYSPEQFKAMVASLKKEAAAVQKSSVTASKDLRERSFIPSEAKSPAGPGGTGETAGTTIDPKREAERVVLLQRELADKKAEKPTKPNDIRIRDDNIAAIRSELKRLKAPEEANAAPPTATKEPVGKQSADKNGRKMEFVGKSAQYPSGYRYVAGAQ